MIVTENSNSEIPSEKSKFKWEYVAVLTCTLLMLCVGASSGWYSPSLAKLLANDATIPLNKSQASWLASISGLGMGMGPPCAVLIVDRLGRHRALLITIVPNIVSWILIAVATKAATLFVARFLAGLTVGLTGSLTPIYLGEISSTRMRGTAGMMCTVMFNLGAIFSFAVGPHVSISNMALINLVAPILFVLSFWQMPESPYFLAMHGRIEEAEAVLVKLRGKSHVTEELDSIVQFITLRAHSSGGNNVRRSIVKKNCCTNWFDLLFRCPSNRKGVIILMIIGISHHLGGFFSLQVWAQFIFTKIGNVNIAPENAAVVMMIVRLVSGVAATTVADRINRRTLYAVSGLLSTLCTFTLFLYFLVDEVFSIDVRKYSYIGVASLILYMASMSMGVMPLMTVVSSEIFTTDVKAKASCLNLMNSGVIGGITIKLYMVFATSWGHYSSFALYSAVLTLTTIAVIVLLPETKGKTFAEIQIALGNENASREHEEEKVVLKKC